MLTGRKDRISRLAWFTAVETTTYSELVTALTPPRALADVAADVSAGVASAAALHDALLAATVYCERGERTGFVALGTPGDGVVCIYSSPDQVALARGTVPWFSLTGADLLDLLPAGYDLLLDLGADAPLRLSVSALDRLVTIEVELDDAAAGATAGGTA
jgi:hypothetical protein